jgi:hypothetical protein
VRNTENIAIVIACSMGFLAALFKDVVLY